ncbi:unnamed protein product [Brassicogethes aeneus]|uniref:Phosphoinositide phospholipase C n=1 Tax=Brassicogethes aeneus TaxID=1431903 RepID=A0A9P0APT2_BRAAE|nr:unnamed protein product [Brassicogethes aeneus]
MNKMGQFSDFLSIRGAGYIPEKEQVISQLERGTLVTKFSCKKKPERRNLSIRRETGQITWIRPTSTQKNTYDGCVNIREIKEIRHGRHSKDFEKCTEETNRMEKKCFVVFYGSEFNLKTLSLLAFSELECELWVKGLQYLVAEIRDYSYPLQVQTWLRREFYVMESPCGNINFRDLKAFLPKINFKMPNIKLKDLFNEVDNRKCTEIGFDDFSTVYQKMMYYEYTELNLFDKLPQYSSNMKTISCQEFSCFLIHEQNDSLGNDDRMVSQFICDFLKDPQREIQEPYLTVSEFCDFLFSKQNDLWDTRKDKVYHDMSRPMSHYWVSSSHNTYLTGDQVSSESSVEAYVRCLRMGCRCIELDCWDGPDDMPFIFHGHSLTSKIKFKDVIRIIKEHAFATSEYPVILSIEDNCSLHQQRKMATAMQEVFGDLLVVAPVSPTETQLPSPHVLRRKIILKHKKLPDGQDEISLPMPNDSHELDLRNSVLNDIVYIENPADEWNPFFFVLTKTKLFYTDGYNLENQAESERTEEDEDSASAVFPRNNNVPNQELHFSEEWFHRLKNGRTEAEQILKAYAHLGNGTFLVRASVTFVGEYTLSFIRDGKVDHCRIKSKQERQQTKYYFIDNKPFDSLYNLIKYYRSNELKTAQFAVKLTQPVPQPKIHENEEWYHKHLGKTDAEDVLRKTKIEGAFLVRPSEIDINFYTISFRAERKIKHCRIKLEGRLYTIGNVEFESLVQLINYYQSHPLYKKVKLNHPITAETVIKMNMECEEAGAYSCPSYMDPSAFVPKIMVKALYNYQAQHPDELTFCKHAIITNVTKCDNEWWKGDMGGRLQQYFPASFVVEVPPQNTIEDRAEDGSTMTGNLDLKGAIVNIEENDSTQSDVRWIVKLQVTTGSPFEFGLKSKEKAIEWKEAISEVAKMASKVEIHHRELETKNKIAKEMSNLIIYCRSIAFDLERANEQGFIHYEMSSFVDTKAEKLICHMEKKFFLKYHQHQFSRVYPSFFQHMDSSNYNPMNMWNCGSQMVALNYQTGDKPMQLNQAKFRDNGYCGYLLKPDFMLNPDFDPHDKSTMGDVKPMTVSIRIIAGRHLCRSKKSTASPYVEVELLGASFDSGVKKVTKKIVDNGFNPRWNDETCEFVVANPDFALLRFQVQDEDIFGEPIFIGQATYPITCVRTGYRSVWLKNEFSEDLELASLLIHIQISTNENNCDEIKSCMGSLKKQK